MTKSKTKRQEKGAVKRLGVHLPFSASELKDPKQVAQSLLECLNTNDPGSFWQILMSFMLSTDQLRLARSRDVGRLFVIDLDAPDTGAPMKRKRSHKS